MSYLVNNPNKLYDIVDKVLISFLHTAKTKHIKFQNDIPNGLWSINGNTDIIILLLVNLIDNAIKFTSKKGLIEIGAKSQKKELKVWVRDSGKGIPNEYQKKIFERQFRHNNSYRGNGIGLSIVKRIINYYGGKIWVESEVGKGSIFVFTVPN